ncbi:hypothetical protein MCERE19_01511 [Spirosomataceae bacterium]|jgi:hypothetical protein
MESVPQVSKPTFNLLKELVRNLSSAEKLRLNDFIWEENIEIPSEHQILVKERKEKSRLNPERLIDWDAAVDLLTRND